MSKKVFTPEEVEMLRDNKYTFAVTPHILSFTKEFKELFWEEYQSGAIPRQILEQYGYPADILGKERIWGYRTYYKEAIPQPRGTPRRRHARLQEVFRWKCTNYRGACQ